MFVCAMAVSVVGCKKKEAPPAAPKPATVAAKPPIPQQKLVQKPVSSSLKLLPPEVNQFDFSTKKDPFKPYITFKTAMSTAPDEQKVLKDALPIHRYDVSQFKLIGIVTGGKGNRAMVTDPSGKGYVLKAGMTIGKNEGRITTITNSGVDVLEQFKDDNGKVRKEHIKLTLPRKY